MEAFLSRALSKINEELRAGSTSKNIKKLIDSSDEALGQLKNTSEEQNAAKYFGLLRQACETQNVAATTVALDCIQKLIAHGYLKGDEMVTKPQSEKAEGGTEEVQLIELIIDTICSCNDFADDGVQLQVIKALLTTITSEHCEVNEGSLLRAVRSCYNIHLVSHSIVNRTTAKATLTQVLSNVFQKMENSEAESLKQKSEDGNVEDNGAAAEAAVAIQPPTELTLEGADELAQTMTNDIDDTATDEGAGGDGDDWPSIDHKNAWLLFRALCKLSMKDSLNRNGTKDQSQNNQAEMPMTVYDPIAVQSKVLSLELLLWVLKDSGPCFRSNLRFVHSVRSYLCVSLLRNCTSAVPEVVGLSLQVFIQVQTHFKHHLKAEVEVFITQIFLPILDSENSTPYHKDLVLDVLFTMCADAATINHIFQNYDADFESADLFQQMVDALARCGEFAVLGI
jgi:brefeldin A-inhibited guanine nucleotide-exchange protein